jgi:hypothetical protein
MAAEVIEQRRASPAWALRGTAVEGPAEGRATALIDDEGLGVGPRRIAWIDTDGVTFGDYRIELTLWPAGTLVLSELGRRFETFSAELAAARNRARVGGMLAHGIVAPRVFVGEWVHEGEPEQVEIQVYQTHITIVPSSQDPFQVPLGTLVSIDGSESPSTVERGPGVDRSLRLQRGLR